MTVAAMTRLALVVVILVTTVACGQSGPPPPPAPTVAGCPSGSGTSVAVGGTTVQVQFIGSGPTTVILSNQSDRDRCSWSTFAQTLTRNGFRVALWEYAAAGPLAGLAAITRAVHADGATQVVLLGASEGAKASLITARRLAAPYVVGVVSLSAEAILQPGIDVAQACAGLTAPTLLVTSNDDSYGSTGALKAIRSGLPHAEILRVPGSDHGVELLTDTAVDDAVVAFLHRVR